LYLGCKSNKKAFCGRVKLLKNNFDDSIGKRKRLCIFATGILRTNLQVSQSRKVLKNARTKENISAIKAQKEKQTWVQGTHGIR